MNSSSRRKIMKYAICLGIIVITLCACYPTVRRTWINRQLIYAVDAGNQDRIEALLLTGADANMRMQSDQFRLLEFVPWFRKPNQRGNSRQPTVLQHLLDENPPALASANLLIQYGADTTVTDKSHRTLLDTMLAQGIGDEDEWYTTIDLLLSHGCSSHTTSGNLLGISVEWQSAKLAAIALRYDWKSDRTDELNSAITYGELDIVRLILKAGTDPNSSGHYHNVPLINASTIVYDQTEISSRGNEIRRGIVIVLIKSGAKLDATDRLGHTALYYARQRRDSSLMSLFATYGNGKHARSSPP